MTPSEKAEKLLNDYREKGFTVLQAYDDLDSKIYEMAWETLDSEELKLKQAYVIAITWIKKMRDEGRRTL